MTVASSSRTVVRQAILKKLPWLGWASTADEIGTSYVKDSQAFLHSEFEYNKFKGLYLHRYNFSEGDPSRWKKANDLNTPNDGKLNIDGEDYDDALTDLDYELLSIHPDEPNSWIAQAQHEQKVRTIVALGGGLEGAHDLSMELPGVEWWDGSLGGTCNGVVAKDTDIVRFGTQSLIYTLTGINQYGRSERMVANPNVGCYMAALTRGRAGAHTMRMYDSTGDAYFGTSRTQTIGGWTLLECYGKTPAGCVEVEFHFGGATSGINLFNVDDCFGPYFDGQTEFVLQSEIDEAYKLRLVRPFHCGRMLSAGIGDAASILYDGDLVHTKDWDLEAFHHDATVNRLRMNQPFERHGPVTLSMEAKLSDVEPMVLESSTTTADIDVVAGTAIRIGAERMTKRPDSDPRWQGVLQDYSVYTAIEELVRPPQARVRRPTMTRFRI